MIGTRVLGICRVKLESDARHFKGENQQFIVGLAAGQNLDLSVHFINPPRSRSMTVSVLPCLFLFRDSTDRELNTLLTATDIMFPHSRQPFERQERVRVSVAPFARKLHKSRR